MKMLCKVHIRCSFDFGIHSTNDTISLLVALLVNNYIPKRWRKELDKVETQIQYILSILFKENTTEKKIIRVSSNITSVITMLLLFGQFPCNCYSFRLTNYMEFYPDNFRIWDMDQITRFKIVLKLNPAIMIMVNIIKVVYLINKEQFKKRKTTANSKN